MNMTLYTSDYLGYYLTLVSWLVSNGIWNVIVESGIIAIPFIAIILQEWLKARSEGADEGNKGALSSVRIEQRVFVAILVIVLAGIPVFQVNVNTIKFSAQRSHQCQVMLPDAPTITPPNPEDTGWEKVFQHTVFDETTLNGVSARVPIWWAFMHAVSTAVTNASVAAIPCGTDLRQIRTKVDSLRIANPALAKETGDFMRDCYLPARAKLLAEHPTLDEDQLEDTAWMGSRYFMGESGFGAPGYYDTLHAKTPLVSWPYNATRDAGLAPTDAGGGYPLCRDWWADSGIGLRARLAVGVDANLFQQVYAWLDNVPEDQLQDAVIRSLVSRGAVNVDEGRVYNSLQGAIADEDGLKTLPNFIGAAAGNVGMTLGAVFALPVADVIRQALPMVLSFIKMAMVICIPLVLLFGTFDLKTLVTLSVVQFALFFVDFWFQLARWVDSTILDALYGIGFGINRPHASTNVFVDWGAGIDNTFGDLLLNLVMATMFTVLPMFWMTALTWVGIKAGFVAQGISQGKDTAADAASKGTSEAVGMGKAFGSALMDAKNAKS
jgi:hypothetical protein